MADRSLRFDVSANDRASGAFGRISAAAEALASRITKLDGKRANIKVAVDTAGLEAKIAKAEADLDKLNAKRADPRIDANTALVNAKIVETINRLQELNKQRASPRVEIREGEVRAEIDQIMAALQRLDGIRPSPRIRLYTDEAKARLAELLLELKELDGEKTKPEVTLGIAKAEAQLVRLRAQLADLAAQKSSPEVDANIAMAEAKLALLKAQLDALRREKVEVKVDVDRGGYNSILGAMNSVRHSFVSAVNSAAMFSRSLRQITLVPSLFALAPTLLGIGSAAQTAAGALALLPAAIGVAGLAFAALKIGFSGFSAALGKMDTATQVKKVNKALSLMGEDARRVAIQIRAMGPAWNSIKAATQNALFSKLGDTIQKLGSTYLPVLKTGFSGLGTTFSTVFRGMGDFMLLPSTLQDTSRLFTFTNASVLNFGAGMKNVVAAFMDLAVVGGSFMPGLTQSFENVTARFKEFIQAARDSGALADFMARGIAQVKEFGGLLSNVGGIFAGLFNAVDKSGQGIITTLRMATAEIENMIKSAQGQAGLIALFQGIHAAVESVLPGIKALFNGIADATVTLMPAVTSVGTAFSTLATAVAPVFDMLAHMAADIIPVVAGAFSSIIGALSGVIPYVIAFGVAIKTITLLGPLLLGLAASAIRAGEAMGMFALALGASGATAQKFATAGQVVARGLASIAAVLPGIGVAILAGIVLWETLGSKAEENADKVIKGTMTMSDAVAAEEKQLASVAAASDNYGRAVAGLEPSYEAAATGADTHAQAVENQNKAIQEQLAKLPPMQRLQAEVTIAENEYQAALARGDTAGAATAADALAVAKQRLTDATNANTAAMETNADALKRNASEQMASSSAEIQAERSAMALEKQQAKSAETMKTAKAGSAEYRTAVLDLKQAYMDSAQAASLKAEKEAEAAGVSDSAGVAAATLKDKLHEYALVAGGEVGTALQKMADGINTSKSNMQTGAASAELYRNQLSAIALEAGGPVADKIKALIPNFDSLGGAHASASAKAAAQAAALRALASGAAPEAAKQLNDLATAIEKVPAVKEFEINGKTEPAMAALADVLAAINAGEGTVIMNGNPVKVQDALNQVIAEIGSSTGTVMIAGQPAPVQDVLAAVVSAINNSSGTTTINGNPQPTQAVVSALIGWINSTPSTHTVNPNVGAARAAIEGLKHPTSSTHTVRVVYQVSGRPRVVSNSGGIAGGGVIGYANGGIVGTPVRASNGFVLPGYSPGRDSVPAILSPGEAVLVPELVRQIGTRNILAANALASGRKGKTFGKIPGSMRNGSSAMARGSGAAGLGKTITAIARGGSPDVVKAIRKLGAQLAVVDDRVDRVENNYNNTFMVSGAPKQIASAVGQRQRELAELGAFGGR